MHISITIYKPSGKYYTSSTVTADMDIPMYSPTFKRFIAENLPAHYEGGFVVVSDCEDGLGFHNGLFYYDELPIA